MKKLTLFLVLISTGISAHSEVNYKTAQNFCGMVEAAATAAQTYRQMGYKPSKNLEELMKTANRIEDPQLEKFVTSLVFELVEHAYTVDLYSTKSAQDKAITGFANGSYLACLKDFKNRIEAEENNEDLIKPNLK
ncbi:hypothetical protein ACT4Z5_18605 (plasmid) [Acinetobacter baumannii]